PGSPAQPIKPGLADQRRGLQGSPYAIAGADAERRPPQVRIQQWRELDRAGADPFRAIVWQIRTPFHRSGCRGIRARQPIVYGGAAAQPRILASDTWTNRCAANAAAAASGSTMSAIAFLRRSLEMRALCTHHHHNETRHGKNSAH